MPVTHTRTAFNAFQPKWARKKNQNEEKLEAFGAPVHAPVCDQMCAVSNQNARVRDQVKELTGLQRRHKKKTEAAPIKSTECECAGLIECALLLSVALEIVDWSIGDDAFL